MPAAAQTHPSSRAGPVWTAHRALGQSMALGGSGLRWPLPAPAPLGPFEMQMGRVASKPRRKSVSGQSPTLGDMPRKPFRRGGLRPPCWLRCFTRPAPTKKTCMCKPCAKLTGGATSIVGGRDGHWYRRKERGLVAYGPPPFPLLYHCPSPRSRECWCPLYPSPTSYTTIW